MSHRFIDTHCHFDFPSSIEDEATNLACAVQVGVGRIVVPAISTVHFNWVLMLVAQHEVLYAALGMYPIVIEQYADEGLA